MLTTAVKDTATFQNSSGQVVDTKAQAETGEFDLAMAAMQALLIPATLVTPQAQNEPDGGIAFQAGTGSLDAAPLFPDGFMEGGAVKNQGIVMQGLNLLTSAAVNENNAGQMPAGAGLSQFSTTAQNDGQVSPVKPGASNVLAPVTATAVAQNQAILLKAAVPAAVEYQSQLLAHEQNNGQTPLVKAGLNLAVKNGVSKENMPLEQKGAAFPPAMKQAVSEEHATLRVSLACNVLQPTPAEDKAVSGPSIKDTSVADGMVRAVEKRSGLNVENAEAFKTSNPDQTEPLKPGLETELSLAIKNSFQTDVVPNNNITDLSENIRRVALPDLKERLAHEIKNALANSKGEPQTQVQLKLEPEHLGQLTVKLFFSNGALSAHFYTGHEYVKEILEGSLQQLRDSLNQHDLNLNEALVFAGNDDQRGDMGRYFQGRNGRAWPTHSGYNNYTHEDVQVTPINVITATADSSQVNCLI